MPTVLMAPGAVQPPGGHDILGFACGISAEILFDLSYRAPAPTAARPPIQAIMAKPMTGKKTT